MRIAGMGVDIIEITRIEAAMLARRNLARRLFTDAELRYCRAKPASQYAHFAGRFAAKEAVTKALGRSVGWLEVSIENDAFGKPQARLSGRAQEAAAGGTVLVSISHSRDYAVAHAVLVRPEPGSDGWEGDSDA